MFAVHFVPFSVEVNLYSFTMLVNLTQETPIDLLHTV